MHAFHLKAIHALHRVKTVEWHERQYTASQDGFLRCVEENHHCNFQLWHEEDRARRDDKGYRFVYQAKRNIDAWNQKRNDVIEKMDAWLIEQLKEMSTDAPVHSETPGMIIDRLSILALKAFHMNEEGQRETAPRSQRELCRKKSDVIRRQQEDLSAALSLLMADIADGKRCFRTYSQFKMYNDPALNPQLYQKD